MAHNPPSTTAKPTARKPYVRIITDKRREQNRRAQKAYRERLKQKLEVLEEQAASTLVLPQTDDLFETGTTPSTTEIRVAEGGDMHSSSSSTTTTTTTTGGTNHPRRASPSSTETSSSLATSAPDTQPRAINLADAFAAAGDLPFGQGSLPGIQFQIGPPTPEEEFDEGIEHSHDDYGDIDMRPIWTVPTIAQQYPTPPSSLLGSKSMLTLTPRRTPSGVFPRRSALADPYINHMHLLGEGNIEASLAIGLALNISRSQYVNDHPSHFPSCYVALNKPDPLSPTNSIASKTVVYHMGGKFMNITPELKDHLEGVGQPMRPTPAQLLHPHPTYLDCIVFPHFRELAVKASADGILDHPQLFTDLMHGGLVCWGGMSGLSNRHGRSTKSGKRDMRESVAWSTRSWEAKRWFLKKWSWLIGTEEEEEARGDPDGIWKGSRWWWSMRGEEDSDNEDSDEVDLSGARVSEVEVGGPCL